MIFKVAWRNIWRNKVRSLVVITAIALGLWAGVFASAFVMGMMEQKTNSVIHLEMSHFQVHHPEFRDEYLPEYSIPDSLEVTRHISLDPAVSGVSGRLISMPMIATANKSGAIMVTGMIPGEERTVTDIHRYIVDGTYFGEKVRNPILISRRTAEEYKLGLHSKMILTLQDAEKDITSGAFRVVGIYDTENPMFDEGNAFVLREDLRNLLSLDEGLHEVAVLLKEHNLADPRAEKYRQMWPDLEIESWKDLSPGMRFMVEAMDTYMMIIVGIILIALLFSIINTMLMAVLERVREIGMLMAVGMNKRKIFQMIMTETVLLAVMGGPIGLALSWAFIDYFGTHGIDLGSGAAYGEIGFSNVIYPQLDPVAYLQVTVMVLVMAVLASIYPAIKALQLNPVEAIRKI